MQPGIALAKCVAILLAYLVGVHITSPLHEGSGLAGAILACTTCIVVMQLTDVKESFRKGALRLLGTFIGAVIAVLYLLVLPFSLPGMFVAIFVLEIISMLLKLPNNGKIATITLVVILIVSRESPDLPPLVNGLLRFAEAAIGAAIGIVAVWLMYLPRGLAEVKTNSDGPDSANK